MAKTFGIGIGGISMEFKEIDDEVFVAAQLSVVDIPTLVEKGIKTLICNRPDGENVGQPSQRTILGAAEKHGINTFYLPINPTNISQKNIAAMHSILINSSKPMLAYCRSGSRSQRLYALTIAFER